MADFFTAISDLWIQYIWTPILSMGWKDIVDILLLTVLLYGAYCFGRVRRAGKLFFGLVVVLGLYVLTDILELHTTNRILSGIVSFGIVVLVVIFQPEIRDGLTKIGTMVMDLRSGNGKKHADVAYIVSEVAEAACCIAQNEHDGALIVLERNTGLKEYVEKGDKLDAEVTAKLLTNIFVDRSPLHDGAVIIRDGRVAAACCKLRLSSNEEVAAGLGTRHRAALGITEDSDCVVVVVSEERHIISIANNGLLKRDYNRGAEDLRDKENQKIVQNQLRQDLFLLMTGQPMEAVSQDAITQEKNKRYGKRDRIYHISQVFRPNGTGREQSAAGNGGVPDGEGKSQEGGGQDGQV